MTKNVLIASEDTCLIMDFVQLEILTVLIIIKIPDNALNASKDIKLY